MRSRIAQIGLIVAGLLIALYPFTLGASPSVSCRGVELSPGQTCAKADGSAVQTYEDRLRTANQAKPIIVIAGLAVAGFGIALLVTTSSASRARSHASRPRRRVRGRESPESGRKRQRHAV